MLKFKMFFLFAIWITGCKIATQLSETYVENYRARYYLFYNDRKANHYPFAIIVSVHIKNSPVYPNQSEYRFYFYSDTIKKHRYYDNSKEDYFLVNDSSTMPESKTTPTNAELEKIFPVSEVEYKIFDKIIYYSDSLKVRDFRFLKKARGFILKNPVAIKQLIR